MNPLRQLLLPAACFFLLQTAEARLGEKEGESTARYGAPTPELAGPTDKPLLEGARELIYNFQGWRVRVAFLKDAAVRIEYAQLPDNGALKPITEEQLKAILEAEKAAFSWREEKPRTGYKELNALKTALGRQWERSDHATASLKLNLLLVLQTRDVEAYEKKLAKPTKATPGGKAVGPKF